MKFKWLYRDVAALGPYLALVLNEADYFKAVRDCKVKYPAAWINAGADGTTHHYNNEKGEIVCIVAINPNSGGSPIQVASLLVHEAVHVVQAYFESIGERERGREQEAYAIQNVAQRLMTEYARQTGAQK